jgi:CBS domain-containing protein
VTDARLYFPASTLHVRDVMASPRAVVSPETPLVDVLTTLLDGDARLIPVVAEGGALRGVISLGHVLRTVDPELAAHLVASESPVEVSERLQSLAAGRAASDAMIARPFVVRADSLLEGAARALTARGLTRVPVVDTSEKLVGILSERAIVSALVAPLGQEDDTFGETLRRSVRAGGAEPPTAGALADRDVPRILETTEYDAVFAAVANARGRLVLVVAANGHLRGIVDDHAMLSHLAPSGAPPGVGAAIRRLLAASQGMAARRAPRARARTAAELLRPAPVVVAEDLPVAAVLARLIGPPANDPAVVAGGDGRPIGVLWRTTALRGLVGG